MIIKDTYEYIKSNKVLLGLVVSVILTGSTFYYFVEKMSIVDSIYFCVITLTTVGYGDISPTTNMGKIFTVFYIFLGLGIILGFIDSLGKHRIKKRISKK